MSDNCARWVELSDRVAAGDSVGGGDADFLRAHGEACNDCRAERELWQKLRGVLEEPSLLFASLRSGGPAGAAEALARTDAPDKGPRRKWLSLAGIGLAAAVALGIGVWKTRAPATATRSAEVRIAFAAGDVQVNQAPARAGRKLERGDGVKLGSGGACVLFEPGVTVCAQGETEFVVERTELARRRLRLLSGSVVARLAPQPKGATFGVETSTGAFIAKGTSFAVEIRGGVAELRVHEGTVSAEPLGGAGQAVRAPASTSLGGAPLALRPLSGTAATRDARLLQLTGLWSEQASCELDISASPGGQVALDGMELGQSPLTALVTHGSHRLALSLAGFGPVAERLTLAHGERVARNYELTPLVVPEPVAVPVVETERLEAASDATAPVRATPLSADELLARAREQRANGRYAEAAGTYRKLLALHPRSDQARAGVVSLGELQLSQLGNAEAALSSFDAYLRSGGALAQEARYGRIRALRKLGRLGDERSAIEAFLRDYPRSVQAAALRSRLSER